MKMVIIDSYALSLIDIANLKELNREHKPVIVVVVDSNGYSKRFKLTEDNIDFILKDVPKEYIIKR